MLTGIVRVNDHDELELRNPLYGAVFTARWVNQILPMNWRGFARAGAVIAVVLFLPYWYTQILPAPFIRTLSGAGAALEQAESAFHSLRRRRDSGRRPSRVRSRSMSVVTCLSPRTRPSSWHSYCCSSSCEYRVAVVTCGPCAPG